MLFSERMGFKPVRDIVQSDSMDDALRNSLWNALNIFCFERVKADLFHYDDEIKPFCRKLWIRYFKKPVEDMDSSWWKIYDEIKDHFLSGEWYEAYDFLEFFVHNYRPQYDPERVPKFVDYCNSILKREISAYRFIDFRLVKITAEEEIAEIEEALDSGDSLQPVISHLRKSLDLLSDRENPDYPNSIKESVSAVEAICQLITHDNKATLGQAIKEVEKNTNLHSSLKKAISNLYGYTSDADGIRHALLEESSLDFEDAKFMLVSCTAFINYLKIKTSKAKIRI